MAHIPFLPFHPSVLALAQEIQRRASENPEANPLEILKSLFEDRPPIDPAAYETMACQINDLMGLANPPADSTRMVLMLTLPYRRGNLFTAHQMSVLETQLFPAPPCADIAHTLGRALDEKWASVLSVLRSLPPQPLLLGTTQLPAESKHPAAAGGALPTNVQDFLLP